MRNGENLAEAVKSTGKLRILAEKTNDGLAIHGVCGIGHTRWATHGEPSQTNAHPHVSGNCMSSGSGLVESEVVGVYNGGLLRTTRPILSTPSTRHWYA